MNMKYYTIALLWIFSACAPGQSAVNSTVSSANRTTTNSTAKYITPSSICTRCGINATCIYMLSSYTCACNEGFSGDGYSCYDINECDYYYYYYNPCNNGYCINTYGSYNCVCSSGYKLQNKTCVDIDECSSPELNSCDALATCYNYYGSYSCSCPAGYFGDGYHCEIDECTMEVCGSARECIKQIGSHSCIDPCNNYTTLNDASRSTSYYSYYYYYYYYYYARSDYYLNGWYRFVGSGGIRMPESCPSEGYCCTMSPMWLNGTHPDSTDGIVNRTACAVYSSNCCYWTSNVQIKACPGGYHVYKFSGTPYYYAGYCTDPATVADSCSCAANEECRLVGGRYSCYCTHADNTSASEVLTPALTCGNQEIKVSLKKCNLQRFNLNPESVHLRDKNCTGFYDFNNVTLITVVSILKKGVCGNQLVNNKTHVIFKNTIYISMDSSVGGVDMVNIDFSCVYPLDMQLSIETAVTPFSSSIVVSVEGTGDQMVTMAFYQDSSYKTPYEGSEILLTSKTILYVGVMLKSAASSQFYVLMRNCYATGSKNASTSAKYDIIKNSCPSQQDSTINVISNGNSPNGQFSVQLFSYVKDSNVVYLHCDIHLCDYTNETCTPYCTGMRALLPDSRATGNLLTLGPIIKQDQIMNQILNDQITKPILNGATSLMAHMATAVLFITGNLLFTIFSY